LSGAKEAQIERAVGIAEGETAGRFRMGLLHSLYRAEFLLEALTFPQSISPDFPNLEVSKPFSATASAASPYPPPWAVPAKDYKPSVLIANNINEAATSYRGAANRVKSNRVTT
jgi:hypothetical protein